MAPDPPEAALVAVEVFCKSRVPEGRRDEIRLECSRRGRSITILEGRHPWNPEQIGSEWISMKVAQLRYDAGSGRWSLHYCDSSERWCPYAEVGPTNKIDPLLAELDADPTGIFWG